VGDTAATEAAIERMKRVAVARIGERPARHLIATLASIVVLEGDLADARGAALGSLRGMQRDDVKSPATTGPAPRVPRDLDVEAIAEELASAWRGDV